MSETADQGGATGTTSRYVTAAPDPVRSEPARSDSTPTDEPQYRLMRLCQCSFCEGRGKVDAARCGRCRGEGKTLDEVSTQSTPQALGLALVTLAEEGEFEGCPIGVIGPNGWLVKPWLPSARNVSDAGRVLAKSKGDSK